MMGDKEKVEERLAALPKNWVWIRVVLSVLEKDGEVEWKAVRPIGWAAVNHGSHYRWVWDHLDQYAARVGLRIKYVPGPRGGREASKWVVVE